MASRVCTKAARTLQNPSSRTSLSKLFTNKSSFGSSTGSGSLPFSFPKPNSNTSSRSSLHNLFSSSRLPVELGCAQSLLPLHSATSAALLTSLLSVHSQSWGCLSEGFATPL